MEGLTPAEQKFFDSGGEEAPADEAPAAESAPEATEVSQPPVQAEVPPEKKEPSKFTYAKDTDNVVDDLGRKYVPLNAVQEARNEKKALQRQLDELQAKWTGGEKKLNDLLAKLQPKEEPPAFADKPLEHLQHKNTQLESTVAALKEAEERRGKDSEVQSQISELQRNIVASEKEFSSKQPDYGDAVDRVRDVWRAEYELAGVPPQLVDSMLTRKAMQFAHAAMQKDQDSAEAIYKLAQRYGYKAAEKPKVEQKDKDKLKQIAEGQEAAKSLTSGKGGGEFGLESLANMSEEEMDEFVKDPRKWEKFSKAA